jgi:hypothetical protein
LSRQGAVKNASQDVESAANKEISSQSEHSPKRSSHDLHAPTTPRRKSRGCLSLSQHGAVKSPTASQGVESSANKEISSQSEHSPKRSSHAPTTPRRKSRGCLSLSRQGAVKNASQDVESAANKEISSQSEHIPKRKMKKRPSDDDELSGNTATSSRTSDEEQSGPFSTDSQSTSRDSEPIEPTSRGRRESSHDQQHHRNRSCGARRKSSLDPLRHRNRSCGPRSRSSSGDSTCSAGLPREEASLKAETEKAIELIISEQVRLKEAARNAKESRIENLREEHRIETEQRRAEEARIKEEAQSLERQEEEVLKEVDLKIKENRLADEAKLERLREESRLLEEKVKAAEALERLREESRVLAEKVKAVEAKLKVEAG